MITIFEWSLVANPAMAFPDVFPAFITPTLKLKYYLKTLIKFKCCNVVIIMVVFDIKVTGTLC